MKTLEQLLAVRYQLPEYVMIFELSKGVGANATERRADAVVFSCYPSKGLHRIAFEIKRNRSDFKNELQQPQKRAWLEQNFHQTYFVTEPNVADKAEIPEGWGLLVATKSHSCLRNKLAARHRELPPLPEHIALSAIRKLATQLHEINHKSYIFKGNEVTQEDLNGVINEKLAYKRLDLDQQIDKTIKERNELLKLKSDLAAPLEKLAMLAGDRNTFPRYRRTSVSDVTVEMVNKWAEGVKANAAIAITSQAKSLMAELENLLRKAEKEGLK